MSHCRRILDVYILSFRDMEGDTLRYLKRENVALTGTECFMPLRQSLMRLFLKNSSCPDVREFWNCPE